MFQKDCPRKKYPSDLTDEQWAIVEPLIPLPSRAHEEGALAGGDAGSPQYLVLPEPQWLPMGYVAARFVAQEHRL